MKTVRLILDDQANYHHTWFEEENKRVTYLIRKCSSKQPLVATNNFDTDNHKLLSKDQKVFPPLIFKHNSSEIFDEIK